MASFLQKISSIQNRLFLFSLQRPEAEQRQPGASPTVFLNICLIISIVLDAAGCLARRVFVFGKIFSRNLAFMSLIVPQKARGCLRHLMRASASILLGSSPSAPPPATILVFLLLLSFLFSNQQATRLSSPQMGSRAMHGSPYIPDDCSTCRWSFCGAIRSPDPQEHHSSGSWKQHQWFKVFSTRIRPQSACDGQASYHRRPCLSAACQHPKISSCSRSVVVFTTGYNSSARNHSQPRYCSWCSCCSVLLLNVLTRTQLQVRTFGEPSVYIAVWADETYVLVAPGPSKTLRFMIASRFASFLQGFIVTCRLHGTIVMPFFGPLPCRLWIRIILRRIVTHFFGMGGEPFWAMMQYNMHTCVYVG